MQKRILWLSKSFNFQGIRFYLNALVDWGLTTPVSWEYLGVCVEGSVLGGCEKDAGFGSVGCWTRCRSTAESEQGRWDATKSRRGGEGGEPE